MFDVSIWNPSEHLFAFSHHLVSDGIEVGEYFDGNTRVAYQR